MADLERVRVVNIEVYRYYGVAQMSIYSGDSVLSVRVCIERLVLLITGID